MRSTLTPFERHLSQAIRSLSHTAESEEEQTMLLKVAQADTEQALLRAPTVYSGAQLLIVLKQLIRGEGENTEQMIKRLTDLRDFLRDQKAEREEAKHW